MKKVIQERESIMLNGPEMPGKLRVGDKSLALYCEALHIDKSNFMAR